MSCIYWDTMLFIYWLEDHREFAPRVGEIHAKMMQRGDRWCTSVFTLGEILAGPYKQNAADVAMQIRDTIRTLGVDLLPFTEETADRYARVRSTGKVSPADAIHLATAGQAGVDLFLTNDRRLQGIVVPGIDFVAGLDVNLF